MAAGTRMISSLFKRKPQTVTTPAAPRTPHGVVVWAVGDIHGRLDLLEPLVDRIRADAAEVMTEGRSTVCVMLGDYIDRGPDSRGVLSLLAGLGDSEALKWRFLRGNHEETMLRFLANEDIGARWCEFGGDATLLSYGLKPPAIRHQVSAWASVADDLRHRLSGDVVDFLRRTETVAEYGHYYFAHAGARPGVRLDRQSERDLMWIRDSFLNSEVGFERIVVHGHTPADAPHIDNRRIGLDTRAYESGKLTAVRLDGEQQSIIQSSEKGVLMG